MRFAEEDDFINKVLSRVRFKYDHNAIRMEFEEHIEDLRGELQAEGMNELEASSAAVLHMGDPEEIGKLMDKAHSPVLGTIWLVFRAAAVILIILTLVSVASYIFDLMRNINKKYDLSTDKYGSVIYSVDVGERFKLDDLNIVIDELVYYEDEVMEIRYYMWEDIFSNSIKWTFSLGSDCFTDENGNSYYSLGGGGGGGPIAYYQNYIEGFPADAEKFIINYEYSGRSIYCEIDLSKAEYRSDNSVAEDSRKDETGETYGIRGGRNNGTR